MQKKLLAGPLSAIALALSVATMTPSAYAAGNKEIRVEVDDTEMEAFGPMSSHAEAVYGQATALTGHVVTVGLLSWEVSVEIDDSTFRTHSQMSSEARVAGGQATAVSGLLVGL